MDKEFLRELQLADGLEAMQRVYAAQAEAKADRKVKRRDRVQTPVLDAAEKEHGKNVRKEQAEKERTQAEVQADVEAAEAVVDGDFSASVINQQMLVDSLKANPDLQSFMDCVALVESAKDRKAFDGQEHFFGTLSDAAINELAKVLPQDINLQGAQHTLASEDVWHMYRGHCLDSFIYDDQISITYDDIRMIPDIVQNYDSVKAEKESGKWSIVFLKRYGNLTYKYVTHISRKHDATKTRHIRLKTGWLIKGTGAEDDFTSRQSQAQTASHFPRTAMITQLEESIKQNYAQEARKIAQEAKKHGRTLHAPNGKITNLTPVQWLAVRLQSFKKWFGDWENDPANASKVVDENGEPLVVYHGTVHGGFRVFDVDGRGKTEGTGAFFTSDKRVAEGYSANFHTGGVKPEVYACFLNIRDPYEVDFKGNSWNRVPDRASGYFVHYDNGESEWFSNRGDADFAVSGYEGKAEIEEDWEESPTLDDLAREVWEESPEVDGIIAKNVVDSAVGANKSYPATDFIVASPNQIKSATDNRGTFDGGNPDITFSIAAADNLRQHYAENPNGTPPEGWWVHGRRGQDNLNTEHVLQLTRRNEVGEQYAGSNGSVWYIRPKANAPILDTRNPEHIQQLRNFVKSELENYDSPIYSDYEHVLLDEKREEITDEDIDKVLSHFIPQDIVNSAEAYDNPEWVQRLWNALEVGFIITPDGAVVLDPMAIEAVRVDEDAEYPGEAPVSFSVSDTLMEDIAMARKRAKNADGTISQDGEMSRNAEVELCTMPDFMRFLGEPDVPVVARVFTLRKLLTDHKLTDELTYEVVEKMNDPLLAIQESPSKLILLLPMDVENKTGDKTPVVAVIEHKNEREGNRYLVSAYSLENDKETKITQQFKKLVYCKYNETAKFTADAPQGRAYDLLRAAISGGHTQNVPCQEDVVKWKQQKSDFTSSVVNLDERALADEVVAAGQGFRANLAFSEQIVREMRGALQRMKKLGSKTRTEREDAIAAMGTMVQVVKAAVAYLPQGYRFSVHPYLNKLEVLAELATTGDLKMTKDLANKTIKEWVKLNRGIDEVVAVKGQELDRQTSAEELAKEYGEMQLQEAMEAIMHRVAGQLRKHADTEVYAFLLDVRFYGVCAKGDGSIARSRVSSGPCSARRSRAR